MLELLSSDFLLSVELVPLISFPHPCSRKVHLSEYGNDDTVCSCCLRVHNFEYAVASGSLPDFVFFFSACVPSTFEYKDAKIQLLDLPGIIEGAAEGA